MMKGLHDTTEQNEYWTGRYHSQNTGWDIGQPSTPLATYIDQLKDKSVKILIPGAGNAYEAQYLWEQGFANVYVLDISPIPLANLQARVPDFPTAQLLHGNFFEHSGQYDLILEQTFFCSFEPTDTLRTAYALQMHSLLKTGGRLVGLWFDIPLAPQGSRPYGGSREQYLAYLAPPLTCRVLEPCFNSIPPRMGNELFGIFQKS